MAKFTYILPWFFFPIFFKGKKPFSTQLHYFEATETEVKQQLW